MGARDSPRGGWNGHREGQFRRRQRAVTAGRRRGTGGRSGRDRRNRGRGAGDRRRGARGRGACAKACAQAGGKEKSRAEEEVKKIETEKEGGQEESQKIGEEKEEAVSLFRRPEIDTRKKPGPSFRLFPFAESAPRVGFHMPCPFPNLNNALLNSGIELSGGAWCLPYATSTISITSHVAGVGTDTADAGWSAITPDAMRRRLLLRREVPK